MIDTSPAYGNAESLTLTSLTKASDHFAFHSDQGVASVSRPDRPDVALIQRFRTRTIDLMQVHNLVISKPRWLHCASGRRKDVRYTGITHFERKGQGEWKGS